MDLNPRSSQSLFDPFIHSNLEWNFNTIEITILQCYVFPERTFFHQIREFIILITQGSQVEAHFERDFCGYHKIVHIKTLSSKANEDLPLAGYGGLRTIYAFRGFLFIYLVMGSISARGWHSQVDIGKTETEAARGGKIFEHTIQMFALVLDIA